MPGRTTFDARLSSRRTIDKSGVWRFREAVLDVDEKEIITHPEGATRLLIVVRDSESGKTGTLSVPLLDIAPPR